MNPFDPNSKAGSSSQTKMKPEPQLEAPLPLPDYGARVQGCTIVKPVVMGSVAAPLSRRRETDLRTHQWTVYLRPYLNEDYSQFIEKVQFKLHESYEEPRRRVVTQPPFEITETGWGGFEIPIKIFFRDPNEKPVTVHHTLKLYEDTTKDGVALAESIGIGRKKPVVAESYDEIVFNEPTLYLKTVLENLPPLVTNGKYEHHTDFEAKAEESKEKVDAARELVRSEIEDLKNKLKLSMTTIKVFHGELDEAIGMSDNKIRTKSSSKKLAKES